MAEDADVFAAYHEQVKAGSLAAIDGIIAPKSEAALDSVYRYTFLHWVVGIFLARISKNRTIREFVAGAIVAPSLMCFIWFTFVGGTAIDLELSGAAEGRIFGANLTYQLYEVINIMLSSGLAQIMSVMIVILLLTYLVTSADSAVLVVNTINAGGQQASVTGPKHIIIWGLVLTAIIAALLLAGGLNAIQSAMIIGAVPFSFIMILMGISLIKALIRDGMRSGNPATEQQ